MESPNLNAQARKPNVHLKLFYTRFRRARVPRAEASVVEAGAVVLRIEAALAAVFFTAKEAVCARGAVGFFAAVDAVPAVALRAPVPVRVGLATVVPDEAFEDKLFFRSPCLVAGLGSGERAAVLGPVAARAVFRAWEGWFHESLTAETVAPRGRVELPGARRSGLDGLSGEVGRDK